MPNPWLLMGQSVETASVAEFEEDMRETLLFDPRITDVTLTAGYRRDEENEAIFLDLEIEVDGGGETLSVVGLRLP